MKLIRQWLEPPVFPGDAGKTALARTMNTLGLYFLVALAISALVYVPFIAQQKTASWALILAFFGLACLARYFLFRGWVRFAGLFFALVVWLACEGVAYAGGGIDSPMMFGLGAITIAVRLLFKRRIGSLLLVGSCLVGLGFAVSQQYSLPLPTYFDHTPLAGWFYFAFSLFFIHWTMNLTVHKLELSGRQNAAREAVEATLRNSEAKYRKLHESLRDGFVYVDMAGKIREFNEVFCQLVGYAASEVETLNYHEITPERWHAMEQAIVEQQILTRGYSQVYEKEYRRKDGTVIPIELRVVLDKDENGQNLGMWAIVRDISARKQVEEALRASQEETQAILDAIPDLLFTVDEEGRIVGFHAPLQEALFLPPEQFLGKTVAEVMPPPAAGVIMSAIAQADRQGWHRGATYQLDIPLVQGGPRGCVTRWYELGIQAMQAPSTLAEMQAQPKRYIALVRDISERMRMAAAELELRNLAEALCDSATALNSTLRLREVLERMLEYVGRVVPHDAANVMLLDPEGDILTVTSSRGYREQGGDLSELKIPLAAVPLLAQSARCGQALVIADSLENPEWIEIPSTQWIRSHLSMPICIRERTVGFLNLDSAIPGFFTAAHAERLSAFATQAAIAVENAELYEEVRKLAITDPLTGIYNRTFFEAELARIGQSRDFPVSVVVADLDNMKTTNDRLGHAVGDELLKRTVQVLREMLRRGDILARIGGDEFAVLLPNTDAQAAGEVLARIQVRLADLNRSNVQPPIYLSLGTSTAEPGWLKEAFVQADQRMYEAKSIRKQQKDAPQ